MRFNLVLVEGGINLDTTNNYGDTVVQWIVKYPLQDYNVEETEPEDPAAVSDQETTSTKDEKISKIGTPLRVFSQSVDDSNKALPNSSKQTREQVIDNQYKALSILLTKNVNLNNTNKFQQTCVLKKSLNCSPLTIS